MSDETRKLTIRIGDEVLTDVKDYVVLVRDQDNGVISRASSDSWAIGACEGLLIEVDACRRKAAEGDGD